MSYSPITKSMMRVVHLLLVVTLLGALPDQQAQVQAANVPPENRATTPFPSTLATNTGKHDAGEQGPTEDALPLAIADSAKVQPAAVRVRAEQETPLLVVPASQPLDLTQFGRAQTWQPSFTNPVRPVGTPITAASADLLPEIFKVEPNRWSNHDALLCIIPLGAGLDAQTILSLILGWFPGPPADLPPTLAAHAANVMLKYCGPFLEAPAAVVRTPPNNDHCKAIFYFPIDYAGYSNFWGAPAVWNPNGAWGDLGRPTVYHFNTSVDLHASHNGTQVSSLVASHYSLPVGYNTVTWRAETTASLFDYIPIYIPYTGYLAYDAARNIVTLLVTLGVIVASTFTQEPVGPYNQTSQSVAVTDLDPPEVQVLDPVVQVEAIEPGGVSQRIALAQAQGRLVTSDACDRPVNVSPSSTPSFWSINDSYDITWTVSDLGPNPDGEPNRVTAQQTVFVTDTLAPILLAPPSLVLESDTIPAPVNPGGAQVFDVADLMPAINHDALALSGVISEGGQLKFPKGQSLVTWTAQDASGNQSMATQLINIKGVGENNPPTANSLTGDDAVGAVSFEPVSITLRAGDPDNDPLWFQIETEPQNGFFVAPLLPYFIEDFRRTARYSPSEDVLIDFDYLKDLCEDPNYGEPVNNIVPLPKDFITFKGGDEKYFAVDDQGNTYVYDTFAVCDRSTTTWRVDSVDRIAKFDPDGLFIEDFAFNSGDNTKLKDVAIDLLRNQIIIVKSNSTTTGAGSVTIYQINPPGSDDMLELVDTYAMLNDLNKVADKVHQFRIVDTAAFDANGILYVMSRDRSRGVAAYKPTGDGRLDLIGFLVKGLNNNFDDSGIHMPLVYDLALDAQGNVYIAGNVDVAEGGGALNSNRIYKFAAATFDAQGNIVLGEPLGWMGKCSGGSGCDANEQVSFGYSCTDGTNATCTVDNPGFGDQPGQFNDPQAISIDPNNILYVADTDNERVQRFTPDGLFAGSADSSGETGGFVLGDFGRPDNIAVNRSGLFVLDTTTELLHVFDSSVVSPLDTESARVLYQSQNNFVGQDTFTFQATDGLDLSNSATVAVNVERNFRPPVGNPNLFVTLAEDNSASLLLDGEDPDEPLDTLSYRVIKEPANGQVTGEGASRTYMPNPDFAGVDSLQFVVEDGMFTSPPVTVTLAVTNTNDAPTIRVPDGYDTGLGFATLVVSATVKDADGDTLYLTVDWGDGSVEGEGKIDEEMGITGPVLNQSLDGSGQIVAEHVYQSTGQKTIQLCVEDNVLVNDDVKTPQGGIKTCADLVVNVLPMVDVAVALAESADPVAQDEPLTYTYVVRNNPPEIGAGLDATNVIFTGTLDSRATVQTPVTTTQGTCALLEGEVQCALGTLAPGTAVSITVDVALNGVAPGAILAYGGVVSSDQRDHAPDNAASETTAVVAPSDLLVQNTVNRNRTGCDEASSDCNLAAAVQMVNDMAGPQRIGLGDRGYALGDPMGDLPESLAFLRAAEKQAEVVEVTEDVEIAGISPMTTTLYGDGTNRLFIIRAGATLTLTDMTLTGGKSAEMGGAILVDGGKLVLRRVILYDNEAVDGGAIANNGGTVEIHDSTLYGNTASGRGGAIYHGGGVLTLVNTTLSSNQAEQSGGALHNSSNAQLTNTTIASNRAAGGGGIANEGGSVTLANTLLAVNLGQADDSDCSGPLTSSGNNLLGASDGCSFTAQGSDQTDVEEIGIGPLQENGGATPTHALMEGSPALDAGTCTLPVDQRGMTRPAGAGCDIGAYESGASGPAPEPEDEIYLPFVGQ